MSSSRQYFMANDCPNCGQQDQEGKWLGARMSSSSWGHNYACCSDKCGFEFAKKPARYECELTHVEFQIARLKDEAKRLRSEILVAKQRTNP